MSDELYQKYLMENKDESKFEYPQISSQSHSFAPIPSQVQNPQFSQPFDSNPQNYPNNYSSNNFQYQNENYKNNMPFNNQNYINPNFSTQINNSQNQINNYQNIIISSQDNKPLLSPPTFGVEKKNILCNSLILFTINIIYEFWCGINVYRGEYINYFALFLAFLNVFLIIICMILFKNSFLKKRLARTGLVLFQICILVYILQFYFGFDLNICYNIVCLEYFILFIGSFTFLVSEIYSFLFYIRRMKYD